MVLTETGPMPGKDSQTVVASAADLSDCSIRVAVVSLLPSSFTIGFASRVVAH